MLWPHHEVEVESLSAVSKVPETLQRFCPEHHEEVVLVGAPEELLVRQVGVGHRLGPPLSRDPQHDDENETGDAGQHV